MLHCVPGLPAIPQFKEGVSTAFASRGRIIAVILADSSPVTRLSYWPPTAEAIPFFFFFSLKHTSQLTSVYIYKTMCHQVEWTESGFHN